MSSPEAIPVFLTCALGGGVETNAIVIGQALKELGWPVTIIAAGQPGSPKQADTAGGIRRLRVPVGNLHYRITRVLPLLRPLAGVIRGCETARAFMRAARSVSPGGRVLIDTYEGVSFSRGHRQNAAICVGLHSAAFAWKENLGEPLSAQYRIDKRAERAQLLLADGVRSPTHTMADYVQRSLAVRIPRLSVFPYLANRALFERPLSERTAVGPVRILHVGRPDPRKGAGHIIAAVPEVAARVPGARFLFVGWSEDDALARQWLSALDERSRVFVRLLGRISYEELLNLYDSADICVIASEYDNVPQTIYESMARGCAVVSTRVGGIHEVVGDGDGGLLVPPKDSRALAEAIIALASDRSFLQEQKLRSRQRALDLFEPGMILKKQMEFYTQAWDYHASL